jgi:hypothetical protein
MKPLRPAWWTDPGPSVWGEEDEFKYGIHPDMRAGPKGKPYAPINETLPPPPPDRWVPGFTLFPERKSERTKAADRALEKFGLR